jgi:hypothetical protein
MDLAAVDGLRVTEGVVGGVLILVALGAATVTLARWLRTRRPADEPLKVATLARFNDVVLTDPSTFGGGTRTARVLRRQDTVAYGYLAVAEEFEGDGGQRWCTLTVSLPGRVPLLVADNRAAEGRPGVPMAAPHRRALGASEFDGAYVTGADAPWVISRVFGPADVQRAMLASPVQRLMLRDCGVMLRTFDGATLDDTMIVWLTGVAEQILASAPSVLTSGRSPARNEPARQPVAPLQPGFYGPGRVDPVP